MSLSLSFSTVRLIECGQIFDAGSIKKRRRSLYTIYEARGCSPRRVREVDKLSDEVIRRSALFSFSCSSSTLFLARRKKSRPVRGAYFFAARLGRRGHFRGSFHFDFQITTLPRMIAAVNVYIHKNPNCDLSPFWGNWWWCLANRLLEATDYGLVVYYGLLGFRYYDTITPPGTHQ